MEMSSHNGAAPYYFVPNPSKWPVLAGASLLMTMLGASAWVNGATWGAYLNASGIFLTLVVLYNWFGEAIAESESGKYNARIDTSFRWSMSWFIFSEVMFFGGFFGALFYARSISMPWLADLDHKVLWPDFVAQWGNTGPAGTIEAFKNGIAGPAQEIRLLLKPWGFELEQITCPVTVWYGALDIQAPISHAHIYADLIPGAKLKVIENEGHHSLLKNHIEEILRGVCNKI